LIILITLIILNFARKCISGKFPLDADTEPEASAPGCPLATEPEASAPGRTRSLTLGALKTRSLTLGAPKCPPARGETLF
jgi:hypothetical protein